MRKVNQFKNVNNIMGDTTKYIGKHSENKYESSSKLVIQQWEVYCYDQ